MTTAAAPSGSPPARPRRRRPRWLLLLVLLVAPVLVAEAGVQALIAVHRLPPAAGHLRAVEASWMILEMADPPDVLLLGPSTVHSGIDPAVLGAAASEQLGRPVGVFNLGVPGLGGEPALVEQLERQGILPDVVVIGISPGTLGGRMDSGTPFRASPMGLLFSRCEAPSVRSYEALIDCQVGLHSALWRWRGRLDEVVATARRSVWAGAGGRTRRADGFSEGRPRSVEHIEGQIEAGLRNERLPVAGAGPLGRYERVATFLRERGVEVIGVLIPYAPPYQAAVDEQLPGHRAAWAEVVARLSEAMGIPFVDPGDFGAWWGDGSSQNIKHLSHQGAVDFTNQLWATPEFRDAILRGLDGAVTPSQAPPSPAPPSPAPPG